MIKVYRTRFDRSKFPDRNEFYYGVHNCSKPNYKGSGVVITQYMKKYGIDSFICDTIAEFDNESDAYELERYIVDETMISNENCLNVAVGGKTPTRGMLGKSQSANQRLKVSESSKKWHKERQMRDGIPIKWIRGSRLKGENNGMFGKRDDNPAARSCTDGINVFPTIKRMAEHHNIGYSAANARIKRGYKQWNYVRKEDDQL